MPNFTQIGQTVQISIRYEYIYFVLYILDYLGNYCGMAVIVTLEEVWLKLPW